MRNMRKAIGAILITVLLAAGCAFPKKASIARKTIAISASLACEASDLATSMYVFGQGTGREKNPFLASAQDRPLEFAAKKVALAAPINVTAAMIWDDHPIMARIMLYGNAAAKCAIAFQNDRIRRPR